MKDKIAFVCQRYGLEVNGGSETHCRNLAERMLPFYDVEVYTTCALDYVTWKNVYLPGTEAINGVAVHRFECDRPRNFQKFAKINERVFSNPHHSDLDEEEWIEEVGPFCPKLLEAIAKRHSEFKAVIFMTYVLYPTAKGLPMGFENALLIPTLHDEPNAYLRCFEKVFASPKGIIWNADAERSFAARRFPPTKEIPGIIAGVGIETPQGELPNLPESIRDTDYIVYAGRIEEGKGCGRMFECFLRYNKEHSGSLKLVLMGKAVMPVPEHKDIIQLGFVSEEIKFAVMGEAKALVLFSQCESLSAVVLESMAMRRPVLVNGACEVLKDHCLKSNAGLYFENYAEFAAALDYLLTHKKEYEAMRLNGKRYVEENYQWDKIIKKILDFIECGNGGVS